MRVMDPSRRGLTSPRLLENMSGMVTVTMSVARTVRMGMASAVWKKP